MQRLLTEWMAPPRQRRRVELNALALPLSTVRPIREGKFIVRQVPAETVAAFEAMLCESNGDATTMNRLWRLFAEFQVLNPHADRTVQVGLFIVDIVSQGVKASSAITYSRLLLEAASRNGNPFTGPVLKDILKCLNLKDAEEDATHAPDLDLDTAWLITLALSGKARLTAFCLLVIGARCADAERLTTSDFLLEPSGRLRVSFRVTKNHRSANSRYSIVVTPKHYIPELRDIFKKAKVPLSTLTCTDFNREVVGVCRRIGVVPKEKEYTSYSFRRCFVQACIAENVSGNTTDWLAVARLTGHHSIEVLRNKYTLPFQNTL